MCSIPGLPSPGSNVTVIITRVNVNPHCVLVEFWGNFGQDQKLVYQQMKKEIQYPGDTLHEGEGKPGDLCLVRVRETWYRARIVSRTDAHYNVFLIDEGKPLQAHTSSLAWGQTDFFNLSPEVEFCILSNVLPLSGKNRWSKLALEFMKSFCGKAVTACVLDFAIPQRAFLLDIPCLSRQMQEMGFAKKASNEEFKAFVLRYLQSDAGSVEPLRIASVGFESIKTACYMYPELQTETTETVLVTEVNNPLRVFCQLKVFSQELQKLTEQITRSCERTIGSSFARPENLGASCASRGADGKWYRSVLQQVVPINNVVEVLYVDYGKKQLVPIGHVRPLAPEFFRMPVVTYVCSLHGVIDQGVGWTVSQIDYLKSLLLNKTLIAKFEYRSLSEGVYYVTLYGDENANLNKLFALKANCSIDSMCAVDYTIHKTGNVRGDCQKCQISVKGETQETGYLKGIFTEALSPNSEHVAVVQHVDSPSKFWIQTQKYAVEFNTMMNGLTELYNDQTGVSGLIREPKAGVVCVAKAKDGVFYRAAVCEVSEAKAELFFLDYGNKEWVECSNLRELPLGYKNIPALAIKCALYGIQPKNKEWDLNATLFFARAVVDKVLDVHVVAKSQDAYLVKVIDSLSCGESDFSKLLCSVGFAAMKAMDEPVVTPYNKLVQLSDAFKTVAASQSSSSTFTEYFFPIGSSFDVTVCYIESPNDFWCQKVNDAKCLKLLMQNLQRYYANAEFQPLLEAACVARHPETGMWFRALVIEELQACNVTVLFVDFGEMTRIPVHDLRRIDPVFCQLKGQAFRCCLHNLSCSVSYSSSVWSPEATMLFREFVDQAASMNVVLKCTVYAVMCDSQKIMFNVVDLESPFQSICKLLVQRGLSEQTSKSVSMPPLRLDTYFYSTHGIKTGSEEDVCITSVKNVNHFYCHLQRNSMQIDKLADEVNRLCRQLESINCSETFGKICFAKYTDGLWYRGQLKSTKPSVVVHFVDYGYTQQVQKSELLPVPINAAEIMAISVQAIECGLSDVPESVPSELNIWFESFVTNRQLKALIVAKEPSGKLIVQLYDGKIPVNAIIQEKFHNEFERREQIAVEDADVKEQHWLYSEADLKVPQLTSEKHWRAQKCADEEKCSQMFMMKHSAKPSIPKQTELPVNVVEPGVEAEVFISHRNSPLSFFVQLVTDESDICSLVEKLNDDQSNHVPVNPGDLYKGDLVCAVYPDDDCWYRAVIRKAPVGDTADVEFIDFGNTAQVSVSKICILDEMFFQPRYSIHCSLTGEVNFDCDVASNLKTEIKKNADRFLCKFIQQTDSVWEVKLEVKGKLIGTSLFSDTNSITVKSVPRCPDADRPLCIFKNPDLSTGQTFAVYASVIIGPQFFWCQFAEAKRLQEISDVIQKISSNLESKAFNVKTLPIGSGCIALFDEDQIWYRAQVTSGETDAHSVVFVDYGNESKVKMSDVRPLPSEVSDIPPQAFACQLDGFNVSEGSWDDKAAERFFELINDQPLKVKIVKLPGSSDLVTPYFVKLECEELVINDAMKTFWIQNGTSTSIELENAPSATCLDSNATPFLRATKPEDPLCANSEEMHVPLCRSSLKMQEECDGSLTKHEKQAESPKLPHKLTSKDIENPNVSDIQHSQSADVQGECLTDSTDLSTEAFTGSLEHTNANQLETVRTAFPGGPGKRDQDCENVYGAISEHQESNTAPVPEIIKSDLGYLRRAAENIAVGSECVIWSHVLEHWCRAQIVKISNDSTLILLLDQDFLIMVDPINIFEIVPDESLQDEMKHEEVTRVASRDPFDRDEEVGKLIAGVEQVISEKQTQDKELDSCLGDSVAKCKTIEMDSKQEPAQDVCSALVQVATEETGLSAEEQTEHVNEMDELMDFLPVIPPEKAQEGESEAETELCKSGVMSQKKLDDAEYKALACFSTQEPAVHDEGIKEQPAVGVELVITEKQSRYKEPASCLGDVVAESNDLGHDAPQETNKLLVPDVSAEQSAEPDDREISPTLDVAQDLCCAVKVQVQTMEDTEETSHAMEEQEVEHVTETFEQVAELMGFIPAIPLQKQDQEAESEAAAGLDTFGVLSQPKVPDVERDAVIEVTDHVNSLVSETDQGSNTTSDLIKDDVAETEPVADMAVSSDLQNLPDAEEPSASTVTHLTLRIEDTSDDLIYVTEWRVSPTEENQPSSQE